MERDYSIDFIKGIAIIAVIITHLLPTYNDDLLAIVWFGQAVPIFLLITGYLTYAGFERNQRFFSSYFSMKQCLKMIKRIFIPFFVITLIQFIILSSIGEITIQKVIKTGGIGPGSYYPWLYLQVWIFLPLIIWIINKFSLKYTFLIVITTCIISEFFTCISDLSPAVYRLSAYRYIMVVTLGCLIKKQGITSLTNLIIILAATSLCFSIVEIYSNIDFRPYFTDMWKGYHWSTAFYPMFIFIFLRIIFVKVKESNVTSIIVILGKYSYEIFLSQMFVFSVLPIRYFEFIEQKYIKIGVFIICAIALSIVPVLIYKLYIKKYIKRKNELTA